jgi:hypothetical protein
LQRRADVRRVAGGDFDGLGDVAPVDRAPALTTKAASVYFPDALMPIASHAHLEHFWVLLGGANVKRKQDHS